MYSLLSHVSAPIGVLEVKLNVLNNDKPTDRTNDGQSGSQGSLTSNNLHYYC